MRHVRVQRSTSEFSGEKGLSGWVFFYAKGSNSFVRAALIALKERTPTRGAVKERHPYANSPFKWEDRQLSSGVDHLGIVIGK